MVLRTRVHPSGTRQLVLRRDAGLPPARVRRYTPGVDTFTCRELELVRKLRNEAIDQTLELHEPCPIHSACTPLPVFRVRRESEEEFAAEWNDFHRPGPRQRFEFARVTGA